MIGWPYSPADLPESVEDGPEAPLLVHVLGPVHGHEEVGACCDPQPLENVALLDPRPVVPDHLADRVARHVDVMPGDPFPEKVRPAPLGVGHQDIARVVDDPPVHLLRHAVVIAAVAGLHVEDGDAHPFGDDRGETAVRVAEDQQPVRPLDGHDLLGPADDPADLVAERAPLDPKVVIGLPDSEVPEEDLVQVRVVVLPGVDQDVVAVPVQLGDDAAQADDLRAGAQDRHDLHLSSSPSYDARSSRSRWCWWSVARTSTGFIRVSPEPYSFPMHVTGPSSRWSSGSIGRIT